MESPNKLINLYSVVLLDIEGTTTSISFVKDTLFPYVRTNIASFLQQNWDDPQVQADIIALQAQAVEDASQGMEGVVHIPEHQEESTIDDVRNAVVNNVLWQMDHDRKSTALKQLQGHMWKSGYSIGELCGHVYADVAVALERWTARGTKVYIYSSGSVEAQKLLFGHCTAGNLLKYISGNFDTRIGAKTDPDSYKRIINEIEALPSEILFLTDIPAEADAASSVGMHVMIVVREGNLPLAEDTEWNQITTFDSLFSQE